MASLQAGFDRTLKPEGPSGEVDRPLGVLDLALLGFVFVFAMNLPEALFYLGGPPPVLTQILFVGVAGLVLAGRSAQGMPLISARAMPWFRPLFAWALSWTILVTLGFLRTQMGPVEVELYIARLKMALFLPVLFLIVGDMGLNGRIGPVLALAAALSAGIVIYDFFAETFTTVLSRGAGFFLNPNQAGFIVTLGMLAGVRSVPMALRWPFVALAAIAVVLTFSRGAWLLLMIGILYLFWTGAMGFRRQRRVLGVVILASIGALGLSIMTGALATAIAATPLADYLNDNTLGRLGLGGALADFSANEREVVARYALELFLAGDTPIIGHGLATTYLWDLRVSTHNMYLLQLVEFGLVGLVHYVWLIALLILRSEGIGRVIGLGVMLFSLFTHNLLDSPSRIVFIAFALATPLLFAGRRAGDREDGLG